MKKLLALICALTLLIVAFPAASAFQAFAADGLTLTDGSLFTIDAVNGYLIIKTEKLTASDIAGEFTSPDVRLYKGDTLLADTAVVGTGDKVCLMSGETVLDSLTVVIYGDTDGDGDVSLKDAIAVLRVAVDLTSFNSPAFIAAADISSDNDVSVTDARMILRVAAELDSFANNAPSSKAEILGIYKAAVDKITNEGAAGYDKTEWQKLISLNMNNAVLSQAMVTAIKTYLDTEDTAATDTYAKGTDEAKNAFPACTMTNPDYIQTASCILVNGNYVIKLVLVDEDTPKKGSSIVEQISNSVFYGEDLESELDDMYISLSDGGSLKVVYDDFTVTCTITRQGQFISLTHFATIDVDVSGKFVYDEENPSPISGSLILTDTTRFTNFVY